MVNNKNHMIQNFKILLSLKLKNLNSFKFIIKVML